MLTIAGRSTITKMLKDRKEAGQMLAEKLGAYKGKDAVVLALPRGGVVVGREIATALNIPLDIVTVRKIGHPGNPEFAVCAVDEKGTRLCDPAHEALIDKIWLKEETERQMNEAKRREALYRPNKEPLQVERKIVILTDDGIATGLTIRLAIKAVKKQKPLKIIVAVPVAPPDVISQIQMEADECIILEPPEDFLGAVGAHYLNFRQVEDAEVIRSLGN